MEATSNIDMKKLRKYAPQDLPGRIVLFILMWLVALTYIFMYVWLLFNSFRKSADFNINTFDIFNFKQFTGENWKHLFTTQIAGTARNPVYIYDTVVNTFVIVAILILLAITIPALTGYVVAKYRFKGKKFILNTSIFAIIVPTVGNLATTYKLMQDTLHLTNSFLGIIVMGAGGFGFGFLLFRNFFAAIPWDYAESAFLDGASDLQVFLRIFYPQALPLLVTIAITTFIGAWNDYMTAYIYLPERPTIALGVYQMFSKMENQLRIPVALAGMAFMATISLVVYACFNKVIMNSVSAGGLKG